MMMTNGVGAFMGSTVSGYLIDKWYMIDGAKNWHGIWLAFAIYALIIAIAFAVLFKHKHEPEQVQDIRH
jgi:NHS family xanthosine MFS transporter